MEHAIEVRSGDRFEFGANWARFLKILDDERINLAVSSLEHATKESLSGRTFLDAGSGSGLFSLAARRLGAKVHSFDYDPQSVECTRQVRANFYCDDTNWKVESGSVLDEAYMRNLGQFDFVYSWGVLHHTGAMWKALEIISSTVAKDGTLYISIYNDQGGKSRRWLWIKKLYNRLPRGLRWLVWVPMLFRIWGPQMIKDVISGHTPLYSWNNYKFKETRGMSAYRDLLDWVGGLPFEVAKPEDVFDFFYLRGFELERLKTCGGGLGCNEFVFTKKS
jgi:2-polyprenyl-6-hydroxyphenyl methylase/3-demethylubiquinone-9 3-methyltransferase